MDNVSLGKALKLLPESGLGHEQSVLLEAGGAVLVKVGRALALLHVALKKPRP